MSFLGENLELSFRVRGESFKIENSTERSKEASVQVRRIVILGVDVPRCFGISPLFSCRT